MKNVVILGSSGSIGENVLRVVKSHPDKFRVVGLAVRNNYARALEQALEFNIENVAVADSEAALKCSETAPPGVRVLSGPDGLEELASLPNADIVFVAVVGMAGLKPTLAALRAGRDVALATKETLVVAGQIVVATAKKNGCRILPVDSEHSAVFQCLEGKPLNSVERIIITASGGPFACNPDVELESVTVAQALKHPCWEMGRKITVDSSTMMNKGLELMEARWLFDVPMGRIDVLVHPESVVHSIVEFVDGSMLAHMSCSDMRFAIQYALSCPARIPGGLPRLDLADIGRLNFYRPDSLRFPCIELARTAARVEGSMPAVLNAANEKAVEFFLQGAIRFPDIWRIIEHVMDAHSPVSDPDLDDILDADNWAGRMSLEFVKKGKVVV